ncbi:MAG TPA: tRNA (5-methylaminomethyl-2-thiouridine)(34)-methyltransferase MnmD [Rhodoferax sp.]|jgi:tRNA 5-methylaminomethyl-2-thiouridine biosynthesis bifunctional protein|nr:tRNA (5-methylaminomethyl-2-thiouridine)(34)-methyltransferase MnmD [Rhodoferax sp.]
MAMTEPVEWAGDDSPRSLRFNDRYRSRAGGVAQALWVFLAGCGLPERWRDASAFTVLETGFGLGINFLTTWAAWEAHERRCERLHYVAVEAYPVAAADIMRSALAPDGATVIPAASSALPARVQALAPQLAGAWQDLSPGIRHLRFAEGRVQLTLAVGEVQPMLERLTCAADAVYLDGFSPALNPDMWSHATLQAVVRHCRAGTTLATYTVARSVRETLEQIGFQVQKHPGLPPKRQRLQAVYSPAGMGQWPPHGPTSLMP